MDYYSLNRSQRDGRLSSTGHWPTADTSSTKWSSVDHRSGTRESSPARDRRLKHWATPPWPYKTAFAFYISCSSWTKTPRMARNAYQCLLAIQSILWLHRIKLNVWQQMAMLTTSIYIEPISIIKISWPFMCRGVCRCGWWGCQNTLQQLATPRNPRSRGLIL